MGDCRRRLAERCLPRNQLKADNEPSPNVCRRKSECDAGSQRATVLQNDEPERCVDKRWHGGVNDGQRSGEAICDRPCQQPEGRAEDVRKECERGLSETTCPKPGGESGAANARWRQMAKGICALSRPRPALASFCNSARSHSLLLPLAENFTRISNISAAGAPSRAFPSPAPPKHSTAATICHPD